MNSLKVQRYGCCDGFVGRGWPRQHHSDLCVYRCSTGAKVPELQGKAGDHRWHGRRRPWNVAQGT